MELRDYQLDIVEQLKKQFAAGHKHIAVCSPTGSG